LSSAVHAMQQDLSMQVMACVTEADTPAVQAVNAPLALAEFGGMLDDVALLALLLSDRWLGVLQQMVHSVYARPSCFLVCWQLTESARPISGKLQAALCCAHLLHAGLAAALALVAELVGIALLPVEVAHRLFVLALLALLHTAVRIGVGALQGVRTDATLRPVMPCPTCLL
jgi:hypothetical protein